MCKLKWVWLGGGVVATAGVILSATDTQQQWGIFRMFFFSSALVWVFEIETTRGRCGPESVPGTIEWMYWKVILFQECAKLLNFYYNSCSLPPTIRHSCALPSSHPCNFIPGVLAAAPQFVLCVYIIEQELQNTQTLNCKLETPSRKLMHFARIKLNR